MNGVIPFTVKLVPFQIHSLDFLIRHLATGRVFATVKTAGHLETFGGRCARDQIDDRLIIAKRLTAPIRGDEREQPVFNLVPFAGAWREVTDGNRKARFIRQFLQLYLPMSQPRAIASPAICCNKQPPRLRIQRSAFAAPPAADRCNRECSVPTFTNPVLRFMS